MDIGTSCLSSAPAEKIKMKLAKAAKHMRAAQKGNCK
jgi:hypothetical protein